MKNDSEQNAENILESTDTTIVQITSGDRIAISKHFLELMFGKLPPQQYGYLWVKRNKKNKTLSFDVSDSEERQNMAKTAVDYNDKGYDVYFSVCTTNKIIAKNQRAKKNDITGMVALWDDVDIESGTAHQKINLAPDTDTAISFLPFQPSVIVDSGHGIHSYYLFTDFQDIIDENREELETLEKNLLAAIRDKAGDYQGVDPVQDLSRIMRFPGTYNYKCGNENAPLCHIIEENDVRYSSQELHDKITPLLQTDTANKKEQPTPCELQEETVTKLSDEEVINHIRHSRKCQLFTVLFDSGDIINYGNDRSCADYALMSILPFWTNGDKEQMERIFNMSALAQRDKWQNRPDYRERTINNVLQRWDHKCYSQNYHSSIVEPEVEADLNLDIDRNGNILHTHENFIAILNDPALSGLIRYDEFSRKIIKGKISPWAKSPDNGRAWTDVDDSQLRCYISSHYNMRATSILNDVIIVTAHQNVIHPVREFLENLPIWDKIPRAETLFIKTLGVQDSDYSRSITLHWLKAAIKRVMVPGCKFDYCLVVAGSQGIGKSTLFEKLGGLWFNNSIDNINGKDAIEQFIGSWIIELSEMQATRRADNEAIKAFISRTTDKIRLPYAHRAEEIPRQCVFAATTNDHEPLKDKTGGRRFWILVSDASSNTTPERLSILTEEYIRQVWAEVYFQYCFELQSDGDVNLLPPSDILKEAMIIQEEFTEGSELVDQIYNFLDTLIPRKDIWDSLTKENRRYFIQNGSFILSINSVNTHITGEELRQEVCSAEIAYELFGIENLNKDKATLREINTILSHLKNWEKLPRGKRMGIYGSQKNVYTRSNPFV